VIYISDEQEEDKIKPIYVQVSTTTRAIIDKYKKEESRTISGIIEEAIVLYDKFYTLPPDAFAILEKYKDQYENEMKLIEEALRLYDKQKDPEMADVIDLWIRARAERDMMLIGRTTFNQLIRAAEEPSDSLKKPQKKNNAMDVILWYTRKPITRLTLKEIILAIQKMWTISNYFIRIDVDQPSEDTYYMTFIHTQDERYSHYWLGYFEVLFNYLNESKDVPFKCGFEGQAFGQTLSITVRELYEKS